jgi:hypothetical protein
MFEKIQGTGVATLYKNNMKNGKISYSIVRHKEKDVLDFPTASIAAIEYNRIHIKNIEGGKDV